MATPGTYQSAVTVAVKLISSVSVNGFGLIVLTFSDNSTSTPISVSAYSAISPLPVAGMYQLTYANGTITYVTLATLNANWVYVSP